MSLNTYMGVILVQIPLALRLISFGLFYLNILNDVSFPSNLSASCLFFFFMDQLKFHLDTEGDILCIFCLLLVTHL